MPLRLVEIILPATNREDVEALLKEEEKVLGYWQDPQSESGLLVKLLLSAEKTEPILDRLESRFSHIEGFRVLLLPVEATLPRLDPKQPAPSEAEASPAETPADSNNEGRISREELYADVVDSIGLSRVFLAMVVLSSVVAAVGLLRNNVAVVIGAMVIAPLLGPNVGLALATTLADWDLGRTALKTNLVGLGLALSLALLLGFTLSVDPTIPEVAARTQVQLSDVLLALAAGSAAVLSFTSGVPTALIGVMVAVALLPPLVTFGLLLGAGQPTAAWGAFLLVTTNVISVNLAGVVTFLLQGVRPRRWWEAKNAKRATRLAIILWTLLLLALMLAIFLAQNV